MNAFRKQSEFEWIHYSHSRRYGKMMLMENDGSQLTMHNKPPFILNCTVGNEWVLSATSQIFSIVINHGDECEDAQRLIASLRKLLIEEKW